jgi:hypothetical protein
MKTAGRPHRWLVFVHQLPAQPSNARVKIWRRLQQIGAVPVKNAVYVLPNNAQSREDFEWLRTEVAALGGEATIFAATSIRGLDERRIKFAGESRSDARVTRDKSATRKPALDPKDFRGRVWITRPRPGVDRFSSAWLIRHFVDAEARFVFGGSPERAPDAVPFDMYQPAGFKHEGDRCTFEVLRERFAIDEPAIRRIGEIVHDLDLKDDRFKDPHAPTIGILVDGLRASFADDLKLLEQGMFLFEALYQSLRAGKAIKGGKPKIC